MRKEIFCVVISLMSILTSKMVLAQERFVFRKWATVTPAADWAFQAGDFTGDGKLDVVGYHPSDGTVWVGTNAGSQFSFRKWATVTPAADWAFQAGDFTGDGKLDVVGYHPSDGTLWVGTNSGRQ